MRRGQAAGRRLVGSLADSFEEGRGLERGVRTPSRSPRIVPVYPFSGEGSPTKIDYSKKDTLIPTSLLEDLALILGNDQPFFKGYGDSR